MDGMCARFERTAAQFTTADKSNDKFVRQTVIGCMGKNRSFYDGIDTQLINEYQFQLRGTLCYRNKTEWINTTLRYRQASISSALCIISAAIWLSLSVQVDFRSDSQHRRWTHSSFARLFFSLEQNTNLKNRLKLLKFKNWISNSVKCLNNDRYSAEWCLCFMRWQRLFSLDWIK